VALSPGIPTSFVPKQPVQPVRRPMQSGTNLFLIVSLVIAGIVALVAVGTFLYGRFLSQALVSKQAQLATAQGQVDENTIEDFVRLRDRLASAKGLMSNHVVLSNFFDTLETLTLQGVRFDTMKLTIAGDNTAELEMSGTAKSFNALAAQSNAFAGEKRIKRAIFSDITVTTTKLVSFKMTGDIDSKLILEGNAPLKAASAQPPVQTTVATTSVRLPTQTASVSTTTATTTP
jgi:hypothetical protein